jgi:hypothetical protein
MALVLVPDGTGRPAPIRSWAFVQLLVLDGLLGDAAELGQVPGLGRGPLLANRRAACRAAVDLWAGSGGLVGKQGRAGPSRRW